MGKKRPRDEDGSDAPDKRGERAAKRHGRVPTVVECLSEQVLSHQSLPLHCVSPGLQAALRRVDPAQGRAPRPHGAPRRPAGHRHRGPHPGGHPLVPAYLIPSLQEPDHNVISLAPPPVIDLSGDSEPRDDKDEGKGEDGDCKAFNLSEHGDSDEEDDEADEDEDGPVKSEPSDSPTDGGGSDSEPSKEDSSISCPSCDGGVAEDLRDALEEEAASGIASAAWVPPRLEGSDSSSDGGAAGGN